MIGAAGPVGSDAASEFGEDDHGNAIDVVSQGVDEESQVPRPGRAWVARFPWICARWVSQPPCVKNGGFKPHVRLDQPRDQWRAESESRRRRRPGDRSCRIELGGQSIDVGQGCQRAPRRRGQGIWPRAVEPRKSAVMKPGFQSTGSSSRKSSSEFEAPGAGYPPQHQRDRPAQADGPERTGSRDWFVRKGDGRASRLSGRQGRWPVPTTAWRRNATTGVPSARRHAPRPAGRAGTAPSAEKNWRADRTDHQVASAGE